MNQPRLKKLLLALLVLVIAVVVWGLIRMSQDNASTGNQDAMSQKTVNELPTEAQMQAQLEKLKAPEGTPVPTEKEMQVQLEKLKPAAGAPAPTEAEMSAQLEKLKK
jgi:hypothetical protein